ALPATMELVKAEKAFIVEYVPENNQYEIIYTCNTNTLTNNQVLSSQENNYLSKVLDTRNYLNLHEPDHIKGEEFLSALVFPLIIQKEVRGIICLLNKTEESRFSEEDEATTKTLSKLLSATWDSIHSLELATVDNLTRLYL